MALTSEWDKRITHWQKALKGLLYQPIGCLDVEGFVTKEQLTCAQANRGEFRPMKSGTKWGPKWAYGWFRTRVRIPVGAKGRRIVVCPDAGGEGLVFVNGKAAGGFDHWHRHILLTRKARGGERYQIVVEAYAGHGPMVAGGGPSPQGSETVPEPPARQRTMGAFTFGVWEEDAYQLWMDVETLRSLRDRTDADSLRVVEIDAALRDYTVICDLERPLAELRPQIRRARRRLKPLLDCHNGATAPTFYCFGHSHIDVAWLWPLQETERKGGRTLATQLALAAEYPEFRFLQSQPKLYDMLRLRYPELYDRVKKAVKLGRVVPEGGMWVESDTNVPSGEALIRQFLHGKRFFRDEFGVDNELLWLPDVFGYCGALPQIMQGCGVRYFSTAKIFWNYHGGDPFPHNTFFWEGIDGTRILTHLHNDYNSLTSPGVLIDRWKTRVQKDLISTRLVPFGFGDGGGGPMRDHLEYLRREADLEGVPRCAMDSPIAFFRDQEERTDGLPVYVGELYFQCHRGTYTTQARTKRGNRKAELALREAELWCSIAGARRQFAFSADAMDGAWKEVLTNQFHDIIPGSSIHRVYEESEASYAGVIETADGVGSKARASLADADADALTVFNSLSWERSALVRLPDGFRGAAVSDGTPLAIQKRRDGLYAEVPSIPACGWTTLRRADTCGEAGAGAVADRLVLENDHLRVRFNAAGAISSLYDKHARIELSAGICNDFRMYRDVPAAWDAWDIDSTYKENPVPLTEEAQIKVLDKGPLVASLRIRRRLHDSVMTQVVSLRRDSRRVDFDTTIDWQEKHKLLKVNFPVVVRSDEAIHEIQFGHISRPTHASRQFDADRFEVSMHRWSALSEQSRGCAVVNDCKYGVSVEDNSINLTLLRSPLAPDMAADLGQQCFTYSFYAWEGSFGECGVVRQGYDLNVPVTTCGGDAGEDSVFAVDAGNIVIDTVKPADDRSGDVIVRLYESKRMSTRCRFKSSLSVKVAALTDMLEGNPKPIAIRGGRVSLSFRPFEIKTLRLTLG